MSLAFYMDQHVLPMQPPQRPQRPEPEEPRPASNARGCLVVGFFGLLFLGLLIGLAALSAPYAVVFLIIGGAAFAIPFFHYVVWGWWLGGLIRDEEARKRAESAEEARP